MDNAEKYHHTTASKKPEEEPGAKAKAKGNYDSTRARYRSRGVGPPPTAGAFLFHPSLPGPPPSLSACLPACPPAASRLPAASLSRPARRGADDARSTPPPGRHVMEPAARTTENCARSHLAPALLHAPQFPPPLTGNASAAAPPRRPCLLAMFLYSFASSRLPLSFEYGNTASAPSPCSCIPTLLLRPMACFVGSQSGSNHKILKDNVSSLSLPVLPVRLHPRPDCQLATP